MMLSFNLLNSTGFDREYALVSSKKPPFQTYEVQMTHIEFQTQSLAIEKCSNASS